MTHQIPRRRESGKRCQSTVHRDTEAMVRIYDALLAEAERNVR